MQPTSEDVRRIVEQVLHGITQGNAGRTPIAASLIPQIKVPGQAGDSGMFTRMDDAVRAARAAFDSWRRVKLETRKQVIEALRKVSREKCETWARMAVEETGLGRVADKIGKNSLVIEKTPGPEVVQAEVQTGDRGLTLTERAPYGLIAAITPTTNPAATIINNTISFLSGGNTVVFNFHPSARGVCADVVRSFNRVAVAAGAPANIVTSILEPTIESGNEMMKHPDVRLVVVTGGPMVVQAAFASGKKVICAGPGNPPVVVDETADLERAARDIVLGCSFDNNVLCIAEKELFVVSSVADRLKNLMTKCGAMLMRPDQLVALQKVILTPEGKPAKDWVGKDAAKILKQMGIHADDSIRMILCETDASHPFVQKELLMPVLPLVRVRDVGEAIHLAVDAEHGFAHTASIHSRNVENMHEMAVAMNCSIFVKNGPTLSGLGFEGEGSTTMTIASPTGEGCTDARTFTRLRRCVLKDSFRIV